MMLFHTNKVHFHEVLEESRNKPVLLEFYAGWCAPCRALAPALDALSDRYAEVLSAYAVNTDTDAEIAEQYAVDKLPVILMLYRGTEQRWEGEIRIEDIAAAVAALKMEKDSDRQC